ncbi:MAG: hypothetical protein IJV85_03460 [Clostridia bacterium]|nr:hypothetical protein [Clostridia bacterium]
MKRSKTRFIAFICNMVIVLLSIVSIVSYFFMPFWKVEIALNVSGETISELMGGEEGGESNSGESGGEGEMDLGTMLQDLDPIPLKLGIELKTSYILSSYSSGSKKSVHALIDDNINSLINQLYGPLNDMIVGVAKTMVKTTLKETAKETIKDFYKENQNAEKSPEEIQNIMNEAGITDEFLDTEVDKLVEALTSEGATTDSIADAVIATLDDVCTELAQSDNPELSSISIDQETKDEIKAEVVEILSEMADENGNIDLDTFLADFALQMLKGEASAAIRPINESSSASAGEEEVDSKEQLKAELRSMIMEKLPDDVVDTIVQVFQIIGYVIFFTWFTWFYLILKILVKLKMKNNAIKLKLPILLGWLPYLVLCLIPSLALSLLKDPSKLSFAGESVVKTLSKAGKVLNTLGLKVSFVSASIVGFIIAIVLFLFVIFYYGRIRRRLKKIKKGKIVEDQFIGGGKDNDTTPVVESAPVQTVETTEGNK